MVQMRSVIQLGFGSPSYPKFAKAFPRLVYPNALPQVVTPSHLEFRQVTPSYLKLAEAAFAKSSQVLPSYTNLWLLRDFSPTFAKLPQASPSYPKFAKLPKV